MGNINEKKKDDLYMHIKMIGSNMKEFYDIYSKSKELENISKFWEVEPPNSIDNTEELNTYFDYLEEKDENENIRECLILKINDLKSPLYILMLEKMNELLETYKMPLVLLLTNENIKEISNIVPAKYNNIDERLILIREYQESLNNFEEIITRILLRFCSIHNELGDKFNLGTKVDQDFDLIKNAFPFNLNIACIGRFGQGKSTGVNELLKEYKAKESTKGASQTKNLTFYQVDDRPIRVLDIPGFENPETVQDAVNKIKLCGEASNKLQQNIHIILYFFNYSEKRAFSKNEYPIIEELTKHQESQLIYVITHSKPNMSLDSKKKIYNRLNTGIGGFKNSQIKDKLNMFKASENNVVFVNFHKNDDIEPFGTKELFRKIYDFFIKSDTYKESRKSLNKEELEKEIEKKKSEAKFILYPNKIFGALVGAIPFVDLLTQKFIINKNAIVKVGRIFGISSEFIDEEIKKEQKIKELEKNNNVIKPDYIKDNIEQENLDLTINVEKTKEELNDSSKDSEVEKFGKLCGALSPISNMSTGANLALNCLDNMKIAKDCLSQAENLEKAYSLTYGIQNSRVLIPPQFASEVIDNKFWYLLDKANEAKNAASGFSILSFFGIGSIIGVACGGYFTHKYCEELINKFVEYFRNNAQKIENSYEIALSYFK